MRAIICSVYQLHLPQDFSGAQSCSAARLSDAVAMQQHATTTWLYSSHHPVGFVQKLDKAQVPDVSQRATSQAMPREVAEAGTDHET